MAAFAETSSGVGLIEGNDNAFCKFESPKPMSYERCVYFFTEINIKVDFKLLYTLTNGVPRDMIRFISMATSPEFKIVEFNKSSVASYSARFKEIVNSLKMSKGDFECAQFLQEIVNFFVEEPVTMLPNSWKSCGLAIFNPDTNCYELLNELVKMGLKYII